MKFHYRTIEKQAAANWREIYRQAAKFPEGIIEVRRYDAKKEISYEQMKWFHGVPVKIYAEATGCSKLESERFLKIQCGAEWFRRHYDDDRGQAGEVLFQCKNRNCGKLFPRPLRARLNGSIVYCCPNCRFLGFDPLYLLSKTELSVNEFSSFMENCSEYLTERGWNCSMPDKDWMLHSRGRTLV